MGHAKTLDHAPALSLFNPEATAERGDTLAPHMSLAEFFDEWFRPVALVNAAPRNVEQYVESLAYWVRFTEDPPLYDIAADDRIAAKFVAGLRSIQNRAGEPLADNTVRKHCVAMQAVLDRAGAGTRKKPGKKLIESPLIEKPAIVFNDDVSNFMLAELSAILNACHVAETPSLDGLRPSDFWRAVWLFDYNVGVRLGTLIKIEWTWIVKGDPGTTGTWLRVPPGAIKKKHGRRFYLNRFALDALEMLRPAKLDRCFAWPYTIGWLHEVRRRIMAAAGIVRKGWGLHSVRKSCGTELGKISYVAAKMQLGHAAGDVTVQHYQNRVIACDALDRLPQPEFDRDRDGPQLRLF